jgi:regulator of sirC expression with transglutaminase-like and TPR domain
MAETNPSMNENEFHALISLLDDEDPEVSGHVWAKLMDLGREGMDRLEAAWYLEHDPSIQKKIEEIIHQIQLRDAARNLLSWRKEGGMDLMQGWFLVNKIQYPDLDFNPIRNELNRLVNKTWLEVNDRMAPHEKLKVLNHILFVMEGYRPNKEIPNEPDNTWLNMVLDRKKGNVITLSLLYLYICQKLDFPVAPVLLPGYFVLLYNDGETEFYIDVFNGGMFFTRKDLQRFLAEMNVEEKPSYFKPTSNIYTILAMLKQLAIDYKKSDEPERAVEIEQLLEDIEIRLI